MMSESIQNRNDGPRSYREKIEASGTRWWYERYPEWASVYAQMTIDRNDGVLKLIAGGERLLDIGCGFGDILYLCRDRYTEKHGIDPVPAMVRKTELNLRSRDLDEGFTVSHGAAERLPYASEYFDTVTLLDVFEHIDPGNRAAALREIRRVLKPGGELILATPSRSTLRFWNVVNGLLSLPINIIRRQPIRIWSFVQKEFTEEFCSKRELQQSLEEAQLQLDSFERVSFYPAPETLGFPGAFLRLTAGLPWVLRILESCFSALARMRFLNQKMLIRCTRPDAEYARKAA